jgi:hypothetical protein
VTAFGGPVMVAYIRHMAVEKRGWLDPDSCDGAVAVCQAIPGVTGVQTAAYVGLHLRGVAGAVASFVGFGLPAFGLRSLTEPGGRVGGLAQTGRGTASLRSAGFQVKNHQQHSCTHEHSQASRRDIRAPALPLIVGYRRVNTTPGEESRNG